MKSFIITIITLSVITTHMVGQRRNGMVLRRSNSEGSIVAGMGPSFLGGDASSPYLNSFKNGLYNSNISVGFRQKFESFSSSYYSSTFFSYLASIDFGKYSSTDAGSQTLSDRGFSNISNILETSVRGEYSLAIGTPNGHYTPNILFGFLGFGALYSSTDFTNFHKVRSYQIKNNTVAAFIPFGFGYQYQINPLWTVGAEIGWRYALSDFVDGLNTKENSRSNDVLYGLKLFGSYRIF